MLAFLIAQADTYPQTQTIKAFLKDKLPDYMIPSGFIFLDAFPLSANGKIDRLALQEFSQFSETDETHYLEPKTELEQIISQVWQTVLEVEKVGINSNFFDLGGNSLLITKVYTELKKSLPKSSKNFSVVELFKYPTITTFIEYLNHLENSSDLAQKDQALVTSLKQGKNRIQQKRNRAKQIKF